MLSGAFICTGVVKITRKKYCLFFPLLFVYAFWRAFMLMQLLPQSVKSVLVNSLLYSSEYMKMA